MRLSWLLLLLLQEACAGSGFVVGFASPLPILGALASSCAQRLYGVASGISVASGGLGDAAAIGEGGGGGGS